LVAGFGTRFSFTSERHPNPLKVWDVASRKLVGRLDGHVGYCVSLHFSKDGALLASTSRDKTVILWSTQTWKAVHTLQNPDTNYLWEAVFSPDGKSLAVATHSNDVYWWDVATGKLVDTLKGHSSTVTSVAFSPDGRTLASGRWDQTVRLWNVATRRELMRLDPGNVALGQVESVEFSPDGKHLLAAGRTNTAVWSAAASEKAVIHPPSTSMSPSR
jgi:WD40 repeat protein